MKREKSTIIAIFVTKMLHLDLGNGTFELTLERKDTVATLAGWRSMTAGT